MTDEDDQPDQVRYRVTSNLFTPPDEHTEVGDGVYLAPYDPQLEHLDGADVIDVEEWDVDTGPVFLTGPPELVVTDDDRVKVAAPSRNGDQTKIYDPSNFRCERCGTVNRQPDLHLGEELEPPHECSSCKRQGPFTISDAPTQEIRSQIEEIATGEPIWEPPGGVFETELGAVWDEVRDHIETYWDARDREWLYEMATAYAISTWFREEWHAIPHLFIFGKTETGKTRFLNTLKEVCYRAVHTVGASPSYIYRAIDEYNITYFLSEYHDIPEETQQLIDQVIKAGQKRGEVVGRTSEMQGGKYTPENFQPFTHVAVSSQFEPRADIVNRAHQVNTKPADANVPRRVESRRELRGKLLWLRYRYLHSDAMDAAKASAERYMDTNGIKNRLGEKLWCLLTVAELADRDISAFIEEAIEQDEADMSETEDAVVVRVIIDQAFEQIASGQTQLEADANPWDGLKVPYADICEQFEEMTGREMTPSRLGHIVSRLNLESGRYRDGTYVDDEDLRPELQDLAEENNIEWESIAEAHGEAGATEADTDEGRSGQTGLDEAASQDDDVEDIRKDIVEVVNTITAADQAGAETDQVVSAVTNEGWDEERVEEQVAKMLKDGVLTELPNRRLKVRG